mmetsp:Transcript_119766/g.238525  ORF Transcript_119766/g.238525 Transcript_119766/m.238525 type:complete len:272 (+) Transcript_119766:148-963(+)
MLVDLTPQQGASSGRHHLIFLLPVVKPLHALAVCPDCQHRGTIRVVEVAMTMLLALHPEALPPPGVRPLKVAKARLPIIHILAPVCPAIRPPVLSNAVDHASDPLTTKLSPVGTSVHARAADVVAPPLTPIGRAISPIVNSRAVLLATFELTFEPATLLPHLYAIAMLQIIDPFARIVTDVLVVSSVVVDTHAMCNVVLPLSTINVPVCVHEAALAFCRIPVPLALISSTILPPLNARAVPLVAQPLPHVHASIFEDIGRPWPFQCGRTKW